MCNIDFLNIFVVQGFLEQGNVKQVEKQQMSARWATHKQAPSGDSMIT